MMQHKAFIFLVGAAMSGATILAAADVSAADSIFMRKAAEGGMAEVKLGQLAKDKGSNRAVKDFGKRMVTDHGKADDQLKDIASKKGVTLPTSLNAKDNAVYDRLSKLSGDAFDKAYMRAMVRDHETDVSEFRRESQIAKDSDVKDFASKTLTTLEDHLQQAKDTASQVGAMAGTKGTTASRQPQ